MWMWAMGNHRAHKGKGGKEGVQERSLKKPGCRIGGKWGRTSADFFFQKQFYHSINPHHPPFPPFAIPPFPKVEQYRKSKPVDPNHQIL